MTSSGRDQISTLHESTFSYLQPTDRQMEDIAACRNAAAYYADALERVIPPGPDKTYLLRKLREVAMWAVVSITRDQNGAPRVTHTEGK